MNSEWRWQKALLLRVIINAGFGALAMAFVGALCGGITVALCLWIESLAIVALGVPPASGFREYVTNSVLALGSVLGWLMGAIIFFVASVRARPGHLFAPLKSLLPRVALGTIVGALGFCSLFLAVEAARAALTRQSFAVLASMDFAKLFMGVFALMICGAIAGALSKRS